MVGHVLGVVGATGAVGLKIIKLIDERVKDIKGLRLFASARSEGQKIPFRGGLIEVENLEKSSFKGIDYVFFSAGTEVSLNFSQKAIDEGAIVIDNTNAYRMNPDVPLVVPEVNLFAVKNHKGLIANPNCSTIQMVCALAPIHRLMPIKRVVVSTYQSVSGTGLEAIEALKTQTKQILNGEEPSLSVYPHPIAFNLIPQIDVYNPDSGLYREEEKMINETCKILNTKIPISATTVRVPVFYGHSESINVELTGEMSLDDVRAALREAEDIVLMDEPADSVYPTPLEMQDRDEVFIGRLRRDPSVDCGFNMWVVADNLRRGAATNAVKIYCGMAEKYIK